MKYILRVRPEFILHMLVPGHEIRSRCLVGLPEGLTLTGAVYSKKEHWITLTFDGKGQGDTIELAPVFQALP